MCVGGIEAIEFYESLSDRIEKNERELYERAKNRFKYEVAKGIGKPKRTIKAVKAWHKDFKVCGNCGSSATSAEYHYCPICGMKFLENPVTKEKVEAHQISIDEWMGIVDDKQGIDDKAVAEEG